MTKSDWQRFYKMLETYHRIATFYAILKVSRAGTTANNYRTANTSSTKGILIINDGK